MVSLVCEGDRDGVFSLWKGQGMMSLVCGGDRDGVFSLWRGQGWCL